MIRWDAILLLIHSPAERDKLRTDLRLYGNAFVVLQPEGAARVDPRRVALAPEGGGWVTETTGPPIPGTVVPPHSAIRVEPAIGDPGHSAPLPGQAIQKNPKP